MDRHPRTVVNERVRIFRTVVCSVVLVPENEGTIEDEDETDDEDEDQNRSPTRSKMTILSFLLRID